MATTATRRRWTRFGAPARVDGRMLLGVALVAAAVIGGLLFWGSARETVPVLVATRDIPAGHVLQTDDLSVAQLRLEGDLSSLAIPDAELDAVAGRTTGTAVHAGEMLVWPDLATGPVIGAGEVAVTVPVEADAVYSALRPGDAVAVLGTSDKGKPESQTVTLLERAVVYDISLEPGRIAIGRGDGAEDGRGLTNVTLVVPRSDAERLAHAVVNSVVTLAILPPEDGGSQTAAP
ncbi:MAG: RcpC/CpaB family pilus assembly protein [Dehalococcoidia bacterium]|nr:RcpC/CpaB family pilus assembly protein [Dehalococcoidia bacterium]